MKSRAESREDVLVLASIADGPEPVRWDDPEPAPFALGDLERDPVSGARFEPPPGPAAAPKSWDDWSRAFAASLFRTRRLDLFRSPSTGEVSTRGETERDFRARLRQKAREERDAVAETLRGRYAARVAALEERKRRAEQAVARERKRRRLRGSRRQFLSARQSSALSSAARRSVRPASGGRPPPPGAPGAP